MIELNAVNASVMKIAAEAGILMEIKDAFSFYAKGYQHMPLYKNGMWDGKINLFSPMTKLFPMGLYRELGKWAKNNGYTIQNNLFFPEEDPDGFAKFMDTVELSSGGTPIELRDYQRIAAFSSINSRRSLLLSPTGSGKSLILYLILRWHLLNNRKCLLIVPRVQLVEQMYSDFEDYSGLNNWNVEEYVQTISGGKSKVADKLLTISTYQSLQNLPAEYFHQFDVISVDECHLATAKTITKIVDQCVNAHYRVGVTGTLDESKTNAMCLTGLFGPVKQVTTTKSLMDSKALSDIKIHSIILQYEEQYRKYVSKMKYKDEMDWLCANPVRNQFIVEQASQTTGNTLVLFQYVEHGKKLFEMSQEQIQGKQIYLIYGEVDKDIREDVRRLLETRNDIIIYASYQTTSTGVNFKNLSNIIYASPSKSKVRNLQSLGRGLRLAEGKTHCNLFDIGDDLSWKKKKNTTFIHIMERLKQYTDEQLEYEVTQVPLNG